MAERATILFNGKLEPLCSFSLVNRRLVAGLVEAGYRVELALGDRPVDLDSLPDVYLAHDHPYDTLNAPGRRNLFFLQYDYMRLLRADRHVVERLDARFDHVLAPSRFVRDALRNSGAEVPVTLCPLGVDFAEFSPCATPTDLPTAKGFRFVTLGGASDRKGHDILVRAFREEFTESDDVALIVKSQGYEDWLPWFEAVLGKRRAGEPEILHIHGDAESVAGFYAAAHCGVFPFRGEGFGLPILECLASGRPVIVTAGGGPDDYCTPENAAFLRSRPRTTSGRSHLEPDREHLRQLMREAYETRGFGLDAGRIRASVASFTWHRTLDVLTSLIETPARPPAIHAAPTGIGYSFGARGRVSWKLTADRIDKGLKRRFEDYVPIEPNTRCPHGGLRAVVAESSFALEAFAAARKARPDTPTILTRGNGPFDTVVEIINRERILCGLEPAPCMPIKRWRERQEQRLADNVVVYSEVSRRLWVESGRSEGSVQVVRLGVSVRRRPAPRTKGRLRFLFVGTDPFRKGVRLLFEAWDRLAPRGAELVCLVDTEILRSNLLLKCLVRNPSITVRPLVARRLLAAEYEAADCQLLPSLEDGFSVTVAEGMGFGRPAIVSDNTGVSEILTDGVDGLVVGAGAVDELAGAIARVCGDPEGLVRMGEAAFETARVHPWRRFEERMADVVASIAEAREA